MVEHPGLIGTPGIQGTIASLDARRPRTVSESYFFGTPCKIKNISALSKCNRLKIFFFQVRTALYRRATHVAPPMGSAQMVSGLKLHTYKIEVHKQLIIMLRDIKIN